MISVIFRVRCLNSKVYESYVLNWAMDEVKAKRNQYGGVKGCGADHMLVDIWDRIMSGLEDCRAAVVMTSIDHSKAFNRLSVLPVLSPVLPATRSQRGRLAPISHLFV